MIEVVQEYKTKDGLGAMMWKKIYAMSYAYKYKLPFKDIPIDGFLVHPSDGVVNKVQYKELSRKFNTLLYNPWSHIDFDSFEWTLYKGVGNGKQGPGFSDHFDFLLEAPVFNRLKHDHNNNITIHIRRGNVIQENPRYTEEDFYINVLSQIDKIVEKLRLVNHKVYIVTDAPDHATRYKPLEWLVDDQRCMWGQPHLYPDENGTYEVTSLKWDRLKKTYPDVTILNNLDPYSSYKFLINSKVLIPAYSSFSQGAGLLSHNYVFSLPTKHGMDYQMNLFRNSIGSIEEDGTIYIKDLRQRRKFTLAKYAK